MSDMLDVSPLMMYLPAWHHYPLPSADNLIHHPQLCPDGGVCCGSVVGWFDSCFDSMMQLLVELVILCQLPDHVQCNSGRKVLDKNSSNGDMVAVVHTQLVPLLVIWFIGFWCRELKSQSISLPGIYLSVDTKSCIFCRC